MMKSLFGLLATAVSAAMLCAGAVQAQQQGQDQSQQPAPDQGQQQTAPDQGAQPQGPIPAYHSPLAGAASNQDEDQEQTIPDTNSLTGVRNLSLGSPTSRNYWQPHVDIFSTIDSNPLENAGGKTNWDTDNSFSGGVDLHHQSGESDLTLSYLGGASVSNASGVSNGVVQGLDVNEKLSFRRWVVTFIDQLYYLPQSASGFNGLGAVSLPGNGSGGLGSGLTPGQTLLTGQGQSLENSFYTEADWLLTPRSSLTFVGGYSLLHYFDSNLLDFGTVTARGGYNYQVDRKNTVGLDYTFSTYNYSNFHQSITSNAVEASYGRRVTGRLAFQISAGPQIVVFQTPISGSSVGGGTGSASTGTQLRWTLSANVNYVYRRTGLALGYSHGVGGGSGALAGSEADTVYGSVTREMSRRFSSGITGGYSRNSGLAITTTSTPSNQTYDYWYGGGNLTHPIGRSLGITLAYQLQYQTSSSAFCIGPTCGTSVIRHMISFGIGWHERPLLF
jgi:hypothetical protein